jgi:uncharacterized protein YecE (DUF72 family)
MAEARIGTSGWSYPGWRGTFYPTALRQAEWLGYLARRLRTVEVNASFYRLPPRERFARWAEATPADFVLAVKAWRALTHYRRLAECGDLVEAFLARVEPLGPKRGPVLFQLPPHFPADAGRLDAFLAALPQGFRYAAEFRDPSWWNEATAAVLGRHGAAFCVFELAQLRSPRLVTADFVYLRLHGHERRYRGAYGETLVADWAGWLGGELAKGHDVFAYFDNTDEADHAVRDAMRLQALLDVAGQDANLGPDLARGSRRC